jgi:hypothetical protein
MGVFKSAQSGVKGASIKCTILPGEPNYGIIEELRGIVNDEVVIEVRAYVRHGIGYAL